MTTQTDLATILEQAILTTSSASIVETIRAATRADSSTKTTAILLLMVEVEKETLALYEVASPKKGSCSVETTLHRTPMLSQQQWIEALTSRELEILQLINIGLSNQKIADELVIAVGTVKRHTANIYSKLGVCSRTQAIAHAKRCNLMNAIEITNLHKSYGEVEILKGINLQAKRGSLLALLGPNGAGKTTVCILSTLLRYDSGSVKVFGHDVARESTCCP